MWRFVPFMIFAVAGCGLNQEAATERPGTTLAEAVTAYDEGDLKGAAQILNRLPKAEKESREGLLLQAHTMDAMGRKNVRVSPSIAVGNLEGAVVAYGLLEKMHGGLSLDEEFDFANTLHALACCEAMAGDPEKAFGHLKRAYDGGIDDLEFFEQDANLDNVRALPAYKEFRKEAPERARRALIGRIERYGRDQAVPINFTVKDVNDKPISMEEYRGKVVVLDCWATWCAPCRVMIPRLQEFAVNHEDDPVQVLGLNFEGAPTERARQSVSAFLRANPVGYPNAMGDPNAIPDFESLPTMFFVDQDGMLRYEMSGIQTVERIETVVDYLLKNPLPKGE